MTQIWSKIRYKDKILILNTPGSLYEGLNRHFENIILLAALAVAKFPKWSADIKVVLPISRNIFQCNFPNEVLGLLFWKILKVLAET